MVNENEIDRLRQGWPVWDGRKVGSLVIREVLERLIAGGETPSAVEVARLAGVGRDELAEFDRLWPTLPVNLRRKVLQIAVELAENDVEMDFSAVFRRALQDPDAAVRATAIEGLWEDDEFRTAEQLAVMLRRDSAENVRVAAALCLAHFTLRAELGSLYPPAAEKVRVALTEAFNDASESVEVRRRALEALGVLSDPGIAELIQAAYRDPNPRMRASAIYAMGRNCDERWLETILVELESENPEMRYEAARAAGELEHPRAVVPLINRLDDPDLEVRLAVIGALGQIGGDVARRALERCARHESPAIRQAATEALNELMLSADPLDIAPFLRDSTRTV